MQSGAAAVDVRLKLPSFAPFVQASGVVQVPCSQDVLLAGIPAQELATVGLHSAQM